MTIPAEDIYFKKVIDFSHARCLLHFRVSQDLFSSFQVDLGTARLLKSLTPTRLGKARKVLDLGCGYGPLGLTLKKLVPQREVHLVDRDALALAYTTQNAALNAIPDVQVYASLGYDDVTARDFDLIVANIPGKAGESAIAHFLLDAHHHVQPEGQVAIVVVAPLTETVTNLLTRPDIAVTFHEVRSGYAIFHFHFTAPAAAPPPESALARGVYHREHITLEFAELTFTMQTARGLPEFDSLDYATRLALRTLNKLHPQTFPRALVLNPGQGYLPLALWQWFQPASLALVDRDLLSLRYTAHNLRAHGCPETTFTTFHQPGLSLPDFAPVDLAVVVLREEEGARAAVQTLHQAMAAVRPGGTLLLVGSSTAATRLLRPIDAEKALHLKKRSRDKGRSALVLERR
ncbi:MAG TPA: methyltransferase [Anaerolineae bacterium]|nr:methyltransferase [Anaerolineae bacterium]